VLAKAAGVGLLDSALHAPQASYSGHEFHPDFVDKAAVLVVHVARNHPLPDGNKRLAWGCLTIFGALNGRNLHAAADDAVDQMLAVAAGQINEADMAAWISARLDSAD
jgi:death-on-curing protein